jgi:hypothetical protein
VLAIVVVGSVGQAGFGVYLEIRGPGTVDIEMKSATISMATGNFTCRYTVLELPPLAAAKTLLYDGNLLYPPFNGVSLEDSEEPTFVSSDVSVADILTEGKMGEASYRVFAVFHSTGSARLIMDRGGAFFDTGDIVASGVLEARLECTVGRRVLLYDGNRFVSPFAGTPQPNDVSFVSSDSTVLSIHSDMSTGSIADNDGVREDTYGIFLEIMGPGEAAVTLRRNGVDTQTCFYLVVPFYQPTVEEPAKFSGRLFIVGAGNALRDTLGIVRNGDIIQIPSGGTCDLTDAVSVSARVWIRGESRETSVIALTGSNFSQTMGVLDIALLGSGSLISNLTIRTNAYAGNGCINNKSNQLFVSDCNLDFHFVNDTRTTLLGIVSSAGYLCVRGCTFTCKSPSVASRWQGISSILIIGAATAVIVQDNVFTDELPASDTSPAMKAITFTQLYNLTDLGLTGRPVLSLHYLLVKGNVSKINGSRTPSSIEVRHSEILPIQFNPFIDLQDISKLNDGKLRVFVVDNTVHNSHSSLLRFFGSDALSNMSCLVMTGNIFSPKAGLEMGLVSLDGQGNNNTMSSSALFMFSGNSNVMPIQRIGYVSAVASSFGANSVSYLPNQFPVFRPLTVYAGLSTTVTLAPLVAPANYAITVPLPPTPLPPDTFYYAPITFELRATCSRNAPVAITSSNTAVATVVGTALTVVGVGETVLTAAVDGDETSYSGAKDVRPIKILRAPQRITFDLASYYSYVEGAVIPLSATSSSGLSVSYTSSDAAVAAIRGSSAWIVGEGAVDIWAHQAGDGRYEAAASVAVRITINTKACQDISFAPAADRIFYCPGTVVLTPTSTSGLPVAIAMQCEASVATLTSSISGPEAGVVLTLLSPGEGILVATQAGSSQFNPAPHINYSFRVKTKLFQSLSFVMARTTFVYTDELTVSLVATSSSALRPVFSSSNPSIATVNGSTLRIVGTGTVQVMASQDGNFKYNPAASITRTVTVSKGSQDIYFDPKATLRGSIGKVVELSAICTSGLVPTYVSSDPTVATITGSRLTVVGLGETTITASQPGNTYYNAASDVVQLLSIKKPLTAVYAAAGVAGALLVAGGLVWAVSRSSGTQTRDE